MPEWNPMSEKNDDPLFKANPGNAGDWSVAPDFSDAARSRNILPELKEKFPEHLKPDITGVRIIQDDLLCLLEIIRYPSLKTCADHVIERIDLAVFDEDLFSTENSLDLNVKHFLDLDDVDIGMTTTLFQENVHNSNGDKYKPEK